MSWQVGLLLFYVTLVAQALVQRAYSQTSKLPASFPPAISYIIGVTPLGIIVGLFLQHHIHWSLWLGCLLVIEGVFIGLYNWISFKAIRLLPIARFQTIYQSYEIVVIVLGWILLRERLNPYEIIGAIFLVIAALLAVRAPLHHDRVVSKKVKKRAVSLAILSAVVMGIGLVAEKAALHYMNIGAYFIFGFLAQTVSVSILTIPDLKKEAFQAFHIFDAKRSFMMGSLSALCGFFYIVAITKSNNISLITALSAFTLPLLMLASYVMLKERENVKVLLSATLIGCIGILITTLH